MKATINWKQDLRFDAVTSSNALISFDSDATTNLPSPMEGLLTSLAACMAMDVISILEKKRQAVSAYRVEIEGERPEAGVYPRPFTSMTLVHYVEGDNIDEAAVARAVELSETKYCSVSFTLKSQPEIRNEWRVSSPKS
ncbi:MAG: OsmC family protein [Fimbriimonadales bacterium]